MSISVAQSYMPVFPAAQAIELAGRAPWWTPQVFNARADGITNDTVAVQAAITACGEAGGGVVFFPEGTYLISALTVSNPNVYLVGSGIRNTIIKKSASTASTSAITISSNYCGVSNLTIQGLSVASYVADECGINIVGVDNSTRRTNCTIKNVEVYDIGSYGVQCYYGKYTTVNDCYIHDVGYAGIGIWASEYTQTCGNTIHTITPGTSSNAYGIFYSHKVLGDTRTKFATCTNNLVYNIPLWEGLDNHGATHITFANNVIYECRLGIVATIDAGVNDYVPNYCNISDNVIDAGTLSTVDAGIIYAGVDGGNDAFGGVIAGNIIRSHGNTNIDRGAIYCYDTNGLSITDNNIYNSKGVGISLYARNSGVNVVGNTINGIQAGVANASGIIVRSTGNTGLVADNYIDATAEYCLYASAANTSLQFGRNVFVTSGSAIIDPQNLGRGLEIYASSGLDPGNIADGAGDTYPITVTGANLGDAVEFSAPYDLQGITVTAWVSAVNTVSMRFQNETGGAIDLASGTYKFKVTKM